MAGIDGAERERSSSHAWQIDEDTAAKLYLDWLISRAMIRAIQPGCELYQFHLTRFNYLRRLLGIENSIPNIYGESREDAADAAG